MEETFHPNIQGSVQEKRSQEEEEEEEEEMYILVDFPDLPVGSTLLSNPQAISFQVLCLFLIFRAFFLYMLYSRLI